MIALVTLPPALGMRNVSPFFLRIEQKGQGVALSRLVEDHLYWLMVASRRLDDAWWPNIEQGFFGFVPGLLRKFVTGLARKQVAKTYNLDGLGRHSMEEQKGFARRDLDALQGALPAQDFLFTEKPGVFDFTIAALLAGIYDNKPTTWLTDIAAGYPELRAYSERVQASVAVWGRK